MPRHPGLSDYGHLCSRFAQLLDSCSTRLLYFSPRQTFLFRRTAPDPTLDRATSLQKRYYTK